MATNLQQIIDPGRELLTRQEAAAYLKISVQTLASWQTTGRYNLPIVRVGRLVRYARADLDAWLAGRRSGVSE